MFSCILNLLKVILLESLFDGMAKMKTAIRLGINEGRNSHSPVGTAGFTPATRHQETRAVNDV